MPEPPGGYRYYRDPELGPAYARGDGRAVRDLRGRAAAGHGLGARASSRARPTSPRPPTRARSRPRRSTCCAGLLPASSLSHMGIYATGQTYEQLILHLLAHPLPEAQAYGTMILEEVQAVIPSFVARVQRPDRGGEWVGYLERRARAGERLGRSGSACARPEDDDERAGPVGPAARRPGRRGRPAGRAAVRVRRGLRGRASGEALAGARRRASARRCWPTWSASAPTAATGPAAASRRCATGSRSSPTTAPSATCSATGC